MLITFSGLHGTGKTTVAKLVAAQFNLSHVSTGQIFREMAQAHNMDLVDFSEYAAHHPEIDTELDKRMQEHGLKDNVVLDGQLCWYFLKDKANWKVLLICDEATRINRIFDRDREKNNSITLETAKRETLERERIEQERYKKIYGIDLSDADFVKINHDIVVDTTHMSVQDVVETIVSKIRA